MVIIFISALFYLRLLEPWGGKLVRAGQIERVACLDRPSPSSDLPYYFLRLVIGAIMTEASLTPPLPQGSVIGCR